MGHDANPANEHTMGMELARRGPSVPSPLSISTIPMTFEMWFLCAVILVAMVLFVTEKVSIDVTSIFIAFTLMASGLVTVTQGLSGFSNQAALAILSLLILNTGLENTGVLRVVTSKLVQLTGKHAWSVLLVLLPFVAILSAFTNNTAVIAMFLPILLLIGDAKGISPSKLLMPMAFISILGGLCTIIGTSTNLLVNSIARQYGIVPFTFFEFAEIGGAMVIAGAVYMLLIGHRVIPARRKPLDKSATDRVKRFLTEITIQPSPESAVPVEEIRKTLTDLGFEIVQITTPGGRVTQRGADADIRTGDKVLLRGNPEHILKLKADPTFALTAQTKEVNLQLNKKETKLVEAVVAPGSELIGRRIQDLDLLGKYECIPLAIQRPDELATDRIDEVRLKLGDVLLLEATTKLSMDPDVPKDLIVLDTVHQVQSLRRRWTAVLIFAGAIAAAAFNLVPIAISALGGVLAMAVTGCITMNEAYKRVEWKVYFLIAGLIPLGIAIQNTGLDDRIAGAFITTTRGLEPFAVIVILYAFTVVITNIMANNATALLMAPIAIKIAQQLHIDPKALLLTIMFAASTSFFTPVGYHTLTLIYTPGRYKFKDYFLSGLPLTILVSGVACWMIWQRYVPG